MSREFSTPNELKYQFHPAAGSFCKFSVKAPNDAHIALTTAPDDADPIYEVFIGGWRNSKSVIRKNKTKPDVVEVETPNILSENEFRGFWIKWDNSRIAVGKEGEEDAFMTHADPMLFNVAFLGFCTGWGASGNWIVEEPPKKQISWEKRQNGEIPQGGVSGGTDNESGDILLIARAEHEGAITPGKFVPSHGVAYISWGGAEHAKNEYEILCGLETAKWVKAADGEIPTNAFVGGQTEDGEVLYIGRVMENDALMIGKVQPSHKVCYVPYGGEELAYSEYEVLVE